MRDVLHDCVERVGRTVVEERLRKRKQRQQRRRIETGRAQRRYRGGADLIGRCRIECTHNSQLRD